MSKEKDETDKFILMDMSDERSKKIAEVLGNKTCKKILDYLAENSNKSEEDISKELNIPINTVEYNLKKLLKTGLIEKSTNFFWSKRGKKIILYKPAKKHIIISPKNSKINSSSLNSILPAFFIALAFIAIVLTLILHQQTQISNSNGFKTFESVNEIKNFIQSNERNNRAGYFLEGIAQVATGRVNKISSDSSSAPGGESASDFSKTNVQVQGVDEADIIKNDGEYIYTLTGNTISIIDAYPAEEMEILSEIELSDETPANIFVKGDQLVIFSSSYGGISYPDSACAAIGCVVPYNYGESKTNVLIYDISDKENPELDEEITMTGNYFDSRMIGDYVYVVGNQFIYEDVVLPSITKDNDTKVISPEEIYYQDVRDYGFQYTIVLAIDLDNYDVSDKVLLTGSTQEIYVSQNNIYTTFTEYPRWVADEMNLDEEKTLVNKISIDKLNVELEASGYAPGHILNQFSMDEYEGNLRIATTIGNSWNSENPSENNVYILDEDLNILGELEGLAPGESIYSVRFMGERGYVVTFKKVDPLFVIDLSNPSNPKVLGKLKIPGYSDYLHPYDETHIIGIGKDTIEADEELIQNRGLNFAWYQGVKIAIFDVSDVENPIEQYKVVIGDRGTDSDALHEHKAFLFDKEKELLVIPITLAELSESQKENYDGAGMPPYGDITFQGAYVYNLDLEEGFQYKGRITHYDEGEVEDKSGYYWYGNKNIIRSLYMDNTLYTFSNEMLKANDLMNLDEISFVDLPYETNYYGWKGEVFIR
ncbi:MAG: beta-propeller domain-containing protein [Nanoarchaeota archaeon]|nr:beta-propeller domain-containing protein [Nanoarchaeota archaeon]